MFEFLFIDMDDTILDFKAEEKAALCRTLEALGITPTQAVCRRYSQINKAHWEMLERKQITREQVLTQRFAVLFEELGCDADIEQTAKTYAQNLAGGHCLIPGAVQALTYLQKRYRLFLASNGTSWVQRSRVQNAGISRFFEDIFISQDMGVNKPATEFFTRSFARIPDIDLRKTMIIGDSLSSDMLGGKNAGIATCWVNPDDQIYYAVQPDYQIKSLAQLPQLLEKLQA